MSGRIAETNYTSLKERKLSDQSELADFSDQQETFIAVVSKPRGNIEALVDEVWPELGMPGWALSRFLERRAGYRTNSAVEDAHNKAYDDTNLSSIYHNHLETDEAKTRLREAIERIMSGEDLTLVCYEESGEQCHRHILVDEIEKHVERRENSKFELSA